MSLNCHDAFNSLFVLKCHRIIPGDSAASYFLLIHTLQGEYVLDNLVDPRRIYEFPMEVAVSIPNSKIHWFLIEYQGSSYRSSSLVESVLIS